jgi:hypothetical protein
VQRREGDFEDFFTTKDTKGTKDYVGAIHEWPEQRNGEAGDIHHEGTKVGQKRFHRGGAEYAEIKEVINFQNSAASASLRCNILCPCAAGVSRQAWAERVEGAQRRQG